jgi:hypothetical protein
MTDLKIRHGIALIQTTDLHEYPGGDDRLPGRATGYFCGFLAISR